MNHLPNEDSKRPEGGDKRSPAAKVDIAKREEQIVALRLRSVSFAEIGRTVGVSKQAAVMAFQKALRRNTDFDIQSHHRSELAKLDLEEANVWRVMDANKDKPKVQFDGTAQLRGIHIRRAKLLGLDAPAKLDVQAIYATGHGEVTAARMARQAAIERLSLADQETLAELYDRMDENTAAQPAKPAQLAEIEGIANGHEANGTGNAGRVDVVNAAESEPKE
jgi:hypothetical protein